MPSSTSLRASPGFLFRQNIQSLLGQSLSSQNQAANIVSAIHRDTPTRNASAAYTTSTITNTSNTGTHVHMEDTDHILAAGTSTSSSMNSGNSHTTSTTPTNTIVTSTTITVNARHTHTTNTGSTVPPHALLTTTAEGCPIHRHNEIHSTSQ